MATSMNSGCSQVMATMSRSNGERSIVGDDGMLALAALRPCG
jgi:hypothetical protein